MELIIIEKKKIMNPNKIGILLTNPKLYYLNKNMKEENYMAFTLLQTTEKILHWLPKKKEKKRKLQYCFDSLVKTKKMQNYIGNPLIF